MQTYEDFVSFSGEPSRAFDTALTTLLPLGFQVLSEGSSQLVVNGPGFTSTRQNALLGISRAEFTAERSSLKVRAELGGVDRMQRFLIILLVGLGLFDSLIFLTLWYFLDQLGAHIWFLFIPALTLVPWVIIGPILARWIGKRTQEALHHLLQNMALQA
ncbi:MAG: hypothetical protein FJZ98_02655 [Chloroflexi bacterium]|nr:hypothetical protein [Chloroflexota bacterium]